MTNGRPGRYSWSPTKVLAILQRRISSPSILFYDDMGTLEQNNHDPAQRSQYQPILLTTKTSFVYSTHHPATLRYTNSVQAQRIPTLEIPILVPATDFEDPDGQLFFIFWSVTHSSRLGNGDTPRLLLPVWTYEPSLVHAKRRALFSTTHNTSRSRLHANLVNPPYSRHQPPTPGNHPSSGLLSRNHSIYHGRSNLAIVHGHSRVRDSIGQSQSAY